MTLDEMNNLLESGNRAENILADCVAAGDAGAKDRLVRMRELMKDLRVEIENRQKEQKDRDAVNPKRNPDRAAQEYVRGELAEAMKEENGQPRVELSREEGKDRLKRAPLDKARQQAGDQQQSRDNDPSRHDPGRKGRSRGHGR